MTAPKQSSGSIGSESFATVSIDYTVSRQDLIVLRRADWDRINGNVKKLKNPAPFLPQIGWAALTTGVGALIALAAWVPAYGQLPTHGHATYAWITPGLTIFGVLLILVTGACWLLNGRIAQFEQVAVDSVVEDMDNCAKLAEPPSQPEGASGDSSLAVSNLVRVLWQRVADENYAQRNLVAGRVYSSGVTGLTPDSETRE